LNVENKEAKQTSLTFSIMESPGFLDDRVNEPAPTASQHLNFIETEFLVSMR
jgi:hypothetical protein